MMDQSEFELLITFADDMQDEMLIVINSVKDKPQFSKCSHEDLAHFYYLMKFSQMQHEIAKLKVDLWEHKNEQHESK